MLKIIKASHKVVKERSLETRFCVWFVVESMLHVCTNVDPDLYILWHRDDGKEMTFEWDSIHW